MLIERIGAVSGYNSHKEIDFGAKLALPALLADFRMTKNPFVIEGYVSPDYFCDREKETSLLTRHLTNGCNVTLMAP